MLKNLAAFCSCSFIALHVSNAEIPFECLFINVFSFWCLSLFYARAKQINCFMCSWKVCISRNIVAKSSNCLLSLLTNSIFKSIMVFFWTNWNKKIGKIIRLIYFFFCWATAQIENYTWLYVRFSSQTLTRLTFCWSH